MIPSSRRHSDIPEKRSSPGLLAPPGPKGPDGQTLLEYLFEPPLPSPRLPSLLSKPVQQKPPPIRMIFRYILWAVVFLSVFFYADSFRSKPAASTTNPTTYVSEDGQSYEIVGDDEPPKEPTPLVVTDNKGAMRWTVSIPQDLPFPLKPAQYATLCSQSEDVAKHVVDVQSGGNSHVGDVDYYHKDAHYIDIQEAEEQGLLPEMAGQASVIEELMARAGSRQQQDDANKDAQKQKKMCKKSLTFVLESKDAGLGPTLMSLWMSFGLAQKEGRAFFIDDTNWAYGNYTTYFVRPPTPECVPPPRHYVVPFPHQAAHLLVSTATAPWTFGQSFMSHFENTHTSAGNQQHAVFSLLRAGYLALHHLAAEPAKSVATRIESLNRDIRDRGGKEIGIHIRHGDRHPYEYQYQESYIPIENYVDAALKLFPSDEMASLVSRLILASDDPDVYSSPFFPIPPVRAQSEIVLASKTVLDAASGGASSANNGIDDSIGWEGGFFNSLFWSLGRPVILPPSGPSPSKRERVAPEEIPDFESHPTADALRLREFVGRAYLLDLTVLGQVDYVVCAVSSIGCRILAVMMGWDKAFGEGAWRNVDGTFGWTGAVW